MLFMTNKQMPEAQEDDTTEKPLDSRAEHEEVRSKMS